MQMGVTADILLGVRSSERSGAASLKPAAQ